MIGEMKEKVLTYCLLVLDTNWLDFISLDNQDNLLHILVRKKKVGTLIQIIKILSGVKMDFAVNYHVRQLISEE